MSKEADNGFYGGAFSFLSSNMVRMTACSAAPANYAGIAAVALATATVAPGDFSVGNGDTSGRKVTIAAKNGVTIDVSGTANHVVLHDNSSIRGYVTEADPLALTAGPGNTVNFPSWKIEILAPV